MQTLMQAVDEQFKRYDVEKLSNRQCEDLHLAARLANIIEIQRVRRAQKVA